LGENPPRTKTGWSDADWENLASAFAPGSPRVREKRWLREVLNAPDGRLGALPLLWELQAEFEDRKNDEYREDRLHDLLEQRAPAYRPLLNAIRVYEDFARHLQDAFDVLRHRASLDETSGYPVPDIGRDVDFKACVKGFEKRYERARQALGAAQLTDTSLQGLFQEKFEAFGEPLDAPATALVLCDHHEAIQKGKSADGKRPWFDRLGKIRIYIRHTYRLDEHTLALDRYLHEYRGRPVRRFYEDLA
jgi:hypothetical protein